MEMKLTQNLEDWLFAGKIAGEALRYGKELIKPNVLVKDVLDKIEEFIYSKNAIPAFPAQASINEIAAHFCPSLNDETKFSEKDVVKLDVGACYNGAIGDTALTIDLTKKNDKLLEASRNALENAIKLIKPNTLIREIGSEIHKTIKSYNYLPIKNLSGHSLDLYNVHQDPIIPNYDTKTHLKLKDEQIIAIEPFATTGFGLIEEKGIANVFMQNSDRNVRHPFARDVLKKIRTFHNLPFARRWLEKEFGINKTKIALEILLREKIIIDFPPLVEKNRGLVSQFEHTIVVLETPIITTKIN